MLQIIVARNRLRQVDNDLAENRYGTFWRAESAVDSEP